MSRRTVRVGVAEAKATLTTILREVGARRTIIQRRGQDTAVVIGIEELRRLEGAAERLTAGERLLRSLAPWRARYGGVDDFAPAPARIAVEVPVFDPSPPRGRAKKKRVS